MGLTSETQRAIEGCYDAVTAPELWAGALDGLAYSLGAKSCQILPHDYSERPFGLVRSSGMWPWHELWQRNSDWVTDVYAPRGMPFARNGHRALIQSQLFSDDEIKHSRFHQEISRPAGCLHWACAAFSVEDRIWCLPFFRDTEPFGSEVAGLLTEIAGHMVRIVSLAEKFARVGAENEVITLNKASCAAMLIDWRGKVTRINCRAENLLCEDFCIRNGKLWAAASSNLAKLDHFLAEIAHAQSTRQSLPLPIMIARDGAPWLLVEALPVTSTSTDIFESGRAILVVSDLTQPYFTDAALLSLVFGLTSAEARLATAVCKGQDLNMAAKSFGVGRETVRTQLKAIFAKTGARRQAELVARAAQIKNATKH